MPFLFSHTLIMEGLGHGASETWWFQRDSASLDAAFLAVADIKYKRAKLLGASHYIKGERIGLHRLDNGDVVKNRTRVGKFFIQGTQAQESEETNVSLQCLCMNSAQDQKKLVFLFGPWRALFPGGDAYAPAGSWTTFFNQWVAAVKNAGLGWMGVTTLEEASITSYIFDPITGRTTYTLAGPGLTWPDLIHGQRVNVNFPHIKTPLDGRQLVMPVDATHCTTVNPAPAFPFVLKGVMRRLGNGFVGLNIPSGQVLQGSIEAQNPMTRKRGRPLLVSRGRQAVIPKM